MLSLIMLSGIILIEIVLGVILLSVLRLCVITRIGIMLCASVALHCHYAQSCCAYYL